MRKIFFVFISDLNFAISLKEYRNEIFQNIESNSKEKLIIFQEEKILYNKSEDNIDYNITKAISLFKLRIKIYDFNNSLIVCKNKNSFADYFFFRSTIPNPH